MQDIEAILWDFGGVFTTSPFEAFNHYERQAGIPLDFIRGINATNPQHNAWAMFESASVSLAEFDQLFAQESQAQGHRIPGQDVISLLSGDLRPRMVAVLEMCKRLYKVGCITNNVKAGTGPSMGKDPDKIAAVAQVMANFDLVVESSVEGMRKPDPAIYTLACTRLGVAPERTIFLDDLGVNLKPAREMGMQTIKVVDQDQAIDELAALTGLSFPR